MYNINYISYLERVCMKYLNNNKKWFILDKSAFTLAEVLITLGIIGVVSALTLPVLVQKYRNNVVETKLKKFYSEINQAIQLSEAEYGAKETWYLDSDAYGMLGDYGDEDATGISIPEKWFMKYFGSHMTIVQVKHDEKNRPTFYFKDGSALKLLTEAYNPNSGKAYSGARDWSFYTMDPEKCMKIYGSEKNSAGRCAFNFFYAPVHHTTWGMSYHLGKGFEPFKYAWWGNKNTLYTNNQYGCNKNSQTNAYCTAIIQLNGWKIPKEYPYKVR